MENRAQEPDQTGFDRMIEKARHPKILLIHTAFIGDLVLTTPLVREIKAGFADGSLSLLLTPQTAPLFVKSRWVDEIIRYDKRGEQRGVCGFVRMAKQLRQRRFDWVIVPHRSLRSTLLALFSGARVRVGFADATGAWLLTHRVLRDAQQHEIERNLSLLKAVNVSVGDNRPEIGTDHQDRQTVENALNQAGVDLKRPLVGVAPGSVWPTKRWPLQYFKALIHMLRERDLQVVLIGGKADIDLAAALCEPWDQVSVNLVGKLSLTESAELLKFCRVLVTNDSAPLHLASATGTPVVAIFGPTLSSFGFAPFGNPQAILQADLPCRPCGKHGSIKCPLKTHACMTQIYPRQVFEKTLQLLRSQVI